MSLFSSIRMASNALQANQIGLQVVGQNIANSQTPGYIREEMVVAPGPTQTLGGLLLGTGVRVVAVIQKIDNFLEERLRGAISDRSSAEAQQSTYQQLESLVGELSDSDISTGLTNFFNAISEVMNQPESVSTRNLAVLQAKSLCQTVQHLAEGAQTLHDDLNQQVVDMADHINSLLEEVRALNVKIANTEGGDTTGSDAVGLRDQRLSALQSLAELIDIRVQELPSAGVAVYCGSTYLVYEGQSRPVEAVLATENGQSAADIYVSATNAPLEATSGELAGLRNSRDEVLGGFLASLDTFSQTLIYEFNKIYSSGQGLHGYSSVKGEYAVTSTDKPLNEAGLLYMPINGSFEIQVHNETTGLTNSKRFQVDLNGLGDDTSLQDLADMINDAGLGVTASISLSGHMSITSDAADSEFTFADDSSGVLAALGINTFFSGTSARDIDVNADVADDPAKFAASSGGIGADTANAERLAAFIDTPLADHNNESIGVLYSRLIDETTQAAGAANSLAEGAAVFEDTLTSQKMSVSGVSVDEEAVRMMSYQRAYQANAKYIQTLNELLDLLVNL